MVPVESDPPTTAVHSSTLRVSVGLHLERLRNVQVRECPVTVEMLAAPALLAEVTNRSKSLFAETVCEGMV